MWTRCRDSSTPRPGASIRVSIRPGPPRDGSPPPTRTCRTSPCVPRAARPSAAPSSLRPAPCSSRPTIPKSSCASWPISHATRRSSKPSSRAGTRSEEHTSELQSRLHLVCRLLLEKKNKHKSPDGVIHNSHASTPCPSYIAVLVTLSPDTFHLTVLDTPPHNPDSVMNK